MSQESAAKALKIDRYKLRPILANSESILAAPNDAKKRNTGGKDKKVEEALVKWFKGVREKEARITQEMLMVKSEQLAKMLGHDQFKANRGWLYRLCKRSDMKHKKYLGEAGISPASRPYIPILCFKGLRYARVALFMLYRAKITPISL